MKILHIVQGYAPAVGGTELLIQRVSEELVHRFGDEVIVFTTDCYNGEAFFTPSLPHMPSGWEELNGVRIRRFPVRRRLSAVLRRPQGWAYRFGLPFNDRLRALASGPIVPELRQAIVEQQADLISAASFPLMHMFDAIEAAQASRRPCVLTGCLHTHDRWGFDRPMIFEAIKRADAYVALTEFESGFVVDRGAIRDRVHTVGAGVDADAYDRISTDDAKWRLGFDRRPLVGFIGQLAAHKGVDTLLRAMPQVWQQEPDVNLLLAGARTLFTADAERIVKGWPLDFQRRTRLQVSFPDERKPWLFKAIDVLAHASGHESFGISFVEAWAAGKPVIGAESGAVSAMIDDNVDGLLVNYQHDQALARAILDLIRNPAGAAAMGQAGRQKTLARYTWQKVAEKYRQVYQDVLVKTRN